MVMELFPRCSRAMHRPTLAVLHQQLRVASSIAYRASVTRFADLARFLFARAVLRLLNVTVSTRAESMAVIRRGGCLVACNHVSFLDGFIIALASPVRLVYTSEPLYSRHTAWSKTLFRVLLRLGFGLDVVPLGREAPHGARRVVRHLETGASVLVFPEGQISASGLPLEDQPGLHWLQQRTGANIVRISIDGAHDSVLFGKRGTRWRPLIRLEF